MGFLKSYYLNVHVDKTLRRHLQSLKIEISESAMYVNRQKNRAKDHKCSRLPPH